MPDDQHHVCPDGEQPATLPGIPHGLGPIIAKARFAPLDHDDSGDITASVDTVFTLYSPHDDQTPPAGTTPVAALTDLGSQALPAALTARDYPAVLEALAYDVVVIPVIPGPDGQQTRVFESGEDKPYDLYLFSSAETLAAYLDTCPFRSFVVQQGIAALVYVADHVDHIDSVMFDPGSDAGLIVSASEIAALAADTVAVEEEPDDAAEETEIIGYDLRLAGPWAAVDLTDLDKRKKQIDDLVRAQTKSFGDEGAVVRHQIREWLTGAAERATSAGGQQIAFLLAQSGGVPLSMSVMKYWHDFGPQLGPDRHIDLLARQLAATGGETDEIGELGLGDSRIIRQVRVRAGEAEMGGSGTPLLITDYWLGVPGGRYVAHATFSTPHVDQRDAMLDLTDNQFLALDWVRTPQ